MISILNLKNYLIKPLKVKISNCMLTHYKTNLTFVECQIFETIFDIITETNGFCVKTKTDSERAS